MGFSNHYYISNVVGSERIATVVDQIVSKAWLLNCDSKGKKV